LVGCTSQQPGVSRQSSFDLAYSVGGLFIFLDLKLALSKQS